MPLLSRPGILGVNRAHPANRNLLYSYTGVPSSAAYDKVTRQSHVKVGSPAYVLSPFIGHAQSFASASTDLLEVVNRIKSTNPVATIGVILLFNTLGNLNGIFTNDGVDKGLCLGMISATDIGLIFNGVANSAGITVTTGVPYFCAVSCSGNSGITNVIVVRLDTGRISVKATTNGGNIQGPTNGVYFLGNRTGTTGAGANIAACLYSPIFLPMDGLRKWARDPWGPWRDETDNISIISGMGGGMASAHAPMLQIIGVS